MTDYMTNCMTNCMTDCIALVHALEITSAQRDQMRDALVELLRILDRAGGYIRAEDQATVRGACALLAELGGPTP